MKAKAAGLLCIAVSTSRFLLLRRSEFVNHSGKWSTPGGFLRPGERPETGAVREFREETVYEGDIEVLPFVHFVGEYATFVGLVPHEFEPELNWENTEARWFARKPSALHPGCAAFFRTGFPGILHMIGSR